MFSLRESPDGNMYETPTGNMGLCPECDCLCYQDPAPAEWDEYTEYSKFDCVRYTIWGSEVLFFSKQDSNIGHAPDFSLVYWESYVACPSQAAWDSGKTYSRFMRASYGGYVWESLYNSNTGNTPTYPYPTTPRWMRLTAPLASNNWSSEPPYGGILQSPLWYSCRVNRQVVHQMYVAFQNKYNPTWPDDYTILYTRRIWTTPLFCLEQNCDLSNVCKYVSKEDIPFKITVSVWTDGTPFDYWDSYKEEYVEIGSDPYELYVNEIAVKFELTLGYADTVAKPDIGPNLTVTTSDTEVFFDDDIWLGQQTLYDEQDVNFPERPLNCQLVLDWNKTFHREENLALGTPPYKDEVYDYTLDLQWQPGDELCSTDAIYVDSCQDLDPDFDTCSEYATPDDYEFKARCRLQLGNSRHTSFDITIAVEFNWKVDEEEWQYGVAYSNEDGVVIMQTDCIGINTGMSKDVQFVVTDIIWTDWEYKFSLNNCSGCVQTINAP